jgi:nitrate/TMAO reductase-like tetraheme cytochrome c subunit
MTKRVRQSAECISCHAADDAHRSGFGRRCGDCHDAKAWKPASIGRRGGSRK